MFYSVCKIVSSTNCIQTKFKSQSESKPILLLLKLAGRSGSEHLVIGIMAWFWMQIPICLVEMSDNHTVSEMETPWGGDDTQLESQHPRSRDRYISVISGLAWCTDRELKGRLQRWTEEACLKKTKQGKRKEKEIKKGRKQHQHNPEI